MKERYGTISRRNEEHDARDAAFADVKRYPHSSELEGSSVPALIDHRLGTDDEWANYHHMLVEAIRSIDPKARVGAEGSESGDMERMLEGVGMWAPYGGQNVLQRSLTSF